MQEAPNLKKKDEQQERGNYDSAIYMKRVSDILGEYDPKLWFVAISLPKLKNKKTLDKRNKV